MSRKILDEITLKNAQDCDVLSPELGVVRGVRRSNGVDSFVNVVSGVESNNLIYQDGARATKRRTSCF